MKKNLILIKKINDYDINLKNLIFSNPAVFKTISCVCAVCDSFLLCGIALHYCTKFCTCTPDTHTHILYKLI